MKTNFLALFALIAWSCTPCPPSNPACNAGVGGNGGGSGGGSGGGGTLSRYTITTVDSAASDSTYIDMVVDPVQNRVGIAYLVGNAGMSVGDAGNMAPFFAVKYVEWKDGAVGAPETVAMVQRYVGLAVDFNPTTHEPAVAYLGGNADMSLYWFNSDAVVSYRNAGTWTPDTAAVDGAQVICNTMNQPDPVSNNAAGLIVGLWPAIRYDSTGTLWFCYRDVHGGQYPMGDWGGSDVECVHSNAIGTWARECTREGGNDKQAYGGRIRMIMVNDQPVITYDQVFGGSDTIGINTIFQKRAASGWLAGETVMTIANTGTGAQPAFDAMAGWGITVADRNTGILYYVDKGPTAGAWNHADQVYGSGTGGLEPSLAFDPTFHEPVIAYFNCSLNIGANDDNCQPDHQELVISQRVMGNWRPETVTTEHAHRIRLGMLPGGKRVLLYRNYSSGALKLAVEN